MIAILDVLHQTAAEWYRSQELLLHNNCMVDGNPPTPIEQATPVTMFGTDMRKWDLDYHARVREFRMILVCEPRCLELRGPAILTEDELKQILGRIPITQNPPRITEEQFNQLVDLAANRSNSR